MTQDIHECIQMVFDDYFSFLSSWRSKEEEKQLLKEQ